MDNNKTQQLQGQYHFGTFRLDVAERRFWCEDQPVLLTPKQFDLLFYFVENAGRIAEKSDLLDAVWADTYVEESTLARNVSWLRKKIKEYSDDETIIETVPKLGYRFVAEVTHSADENVLIIEEQTVQHFRGEEVITFDDNFVERRRTASSEKDIKRESSKNSAPIRRPLFLSPIFLAVLTLVAFIGSGFVIYRNYIEDDAPKAVVATRVVPFTGAEGYENTPAFSPDGKELAYSWDGGKGIQNNDIYVKLVGAGEPLQLTVTEANEHYPTFSPDGKYIAFVRGRYGEPGEVMIIPSLGGKERQVARTFSGNYSISYSPDGQSIAVIDTEDSTEGGQFAVYLINIETGERRRLTAPAEFIGETTPRFSPDGKNLAFIRVIRDDIHARNLGKQDLFVVPVSGGEPYQITFDGMVINSLEWSADSNYIYFVPIHPPNQTIVRRVPSGGGSQEIVSTGAESITNIDLSPDGKKLVFAEDVRQWKIWRAAPDGQTGSKLIDSKFTEFFPQFSPDGSRIAFQTERTGKSEIWTMDADGKNLRQVTNTRFPASSPQFSPDGSQIVFNQKEDNYFYNYIISAEGGVPRRISPEGVQEDFPVWSADGKYIYFSSNRSGERNIWRINAAGAEEAVQITTIGAFRATPAPDGKTVFFTKTGFPNEFWKVPADGGAEEIIPEFGAAGFANIWTLTTRGIYFIAHEPDQSNKLKFYDFASRQIKYASGDYKIPPNLEGIQITIHENILLCSIIEKSSRLMFAEFP